MLSKYEGLEFNAYLVGINSGKGVAIKARNVPFDRAEEIRHEWNDSEEYFIVVCLVGSTRDIELLEDIKEY